MTNPKASPAQASVELVVNGQRCSVADDGSSLLTVLREVLGLRSPKDGCSPQGQCGCCTVLVEGQPRAACVTPARRVANKQVTTIEGLSAAAQESWGEVFCATGASQCGFCTPGIIMRLAALDSKSPDAGVDELNRSLAGHLCRCTGWQPIAQAWKTRADRERSVELNRSRDFAAASRRAEIEGGSPQIVGPKVALGAAGFADDCAPKDALVAIMDPAGNWQVAETVSQARQLAGKIQGRRSTVATSPPLAVPDGNWVATLSTSWVEPAYLETDASWAVPGEDPHTVLANGGAFGSKTDSNVEEVARNLADIHGAPVRVLLTREDTVKLGPKRPPVAGGIDANGEGVLRVVDTVGLHPHIATNVAPGLRIEAVEVTGPRTSLGQRAAVWAEAATLLALGRNRSDPITAPGGGRAEAEFDPAARRIRVAVEAGEVLDEIVLRSYCVGAAHMAFSWVTSERLNVVEGQIQNLTVRSFGIVKASETPSIEIEFPRTGMVGAPVNASEAVFAAVASAVAVALRAHSWPHGK